MSLPKETVWANNGVSLVFQLLDQGMALDQACGYLGTAFQVAMELHVNRNDLNQEQKKEASEEVFRDLEVAFERAKMRMREMKTSVRH